MQTQPIVNSGSVIDFQMLNRSPFIQILDDVSISKAANYVD